MAITPATKPIGNIDKFYAPVGADEVVMMSVEAGCYYGLNGRIAIRELLETPKTFAELCAKLEIDVQSYEADVLKFTDSLVDNGVVHEAAA